MTATCSGVASVAGMLSYVKFSSCVVKMTSLPLERTIIDSTGTMITRERCERQQQQATNIRLPPAAK